ncbi:MAG: M23 family metallopeptidase [Bacteroidota bacterium]
MRKLALILFSLPLFCHAQRSAPLPPYPQDYFRNPLDIPILLAGNFGECRPGHFHSGVDIKTTGKENLAVRAAGDGYISRIKMDKGGFGHALYITHPNGYTTLYAHLNDFAPAIQRYLRKEQYERKKWDIDISLAASQFPVKKGQQIAFSGNTGSSSAPHLHFEIRNTKTEHPLNPQLFGLNVTDNIAPTIDEVAFYKGNIYETDNKVTVTLAKNGDVYKPVRSNSTTFRLVKDTLRVPDGFIGVGVNVDDYMDGSTNTITFYTAQLFLDDNLQSQVTLDDIGYDETRYINAYADFKTKELQRKWMQCLFKLPGNRLNNLYTDLNTNNGRLDLTDYKPHKVSIVITDNRNNTSTASFYVAIEDATYLAPANCTPFAYNKANTYEDPNVTFTLDERQLYDDICFSFARTPKADAYSDQYRLHHFYVPLHHYFDLQLKPTKPVPFDLRSKVVMMYTDGKDQNAKAALSVDQGWYKASVRDFGTYWLDVDTDPPTIIPAQKNGANLSKAKQIVFTVKDATTSVKTYSGYLDGKWLLFEQHGSKFFYNFDEHCPKGSHEVVFKAEDENGNGSESVLRFTR